MVKETAKKTKLLDFAWNRSLERWPMRTLSFCSAFLTMILFSSPASAVRDVSTKEIAEFCHIHLTISDNALREPKGADLFGSGMCIGYMKGFRDGVDGQTVFAVGALSYCIPADITNGKVGEVYAKWAQTNPEHNHQSAAIGFARAMAESFPCKN